MKKLITLALVLFIGMTYAQDSKSYDTWSLEPHVSVLKVQDRTSVVPIGYGLSVRKMLNTKFGFRINGTYNEMYDDYTFKNDNNVITNPFYTGTFEGVANVGRILEFESFAPWYTILLGVGGTYTYSDGKLNDEVFHRYSNFHLSGTLDNEFKVSKGLALTASLGVITGVNNRPFVPSSTETTNIISFSVGGVLSLGKQDIHADWYVPQPKVDTVLLKPTIIDNSVTTRKFYTIPVRNNAVEYVFFDHNSYNVDKDALNAIVKAADKITGQNSMTVIGYASPPGTVDYNINLSRERAYAVVDKLVSTGLQREKINVIWKGEVETKNGKNVDLSRRVVLVVK